MTVLLIFLLGILALVVVLWFSILLLMTANGRAPITGKMVMETVKDIKEGK